MAEFIDETYVHTEDQIAAFLARKAARPAVDDIVTRLRKIAPIHEGRKGHDCINEAADEIERLRAVLAAVDDPHSPRLAHDTCLACDHDWPCRTHLLIHPEEADRG